MANCGFLKVVIWRGARTKNAPVATPVLVFLRRSLSVFWASAALAPLSAGHHVVGGGVGPRLQVTMLLNIRLSMDGIVSGPWR